MGAKLQYNLTTRLVGKNIRSSGTFIRVHLIFKKSFNLYTGETKAIISTVATDAPVLIVSSVDQVVCIGWISSIENYYIYSEQN